MTIGVPGSPSPAGPGRPMPQAAPAGAEAPPAVSIDDDIVATPDAPAETVSLSRPGWPPAAAEAPREDWPAYGALFGQAGYVKDPGDRRLVDLMKAAMEAEPTLRRPPMGPAVAAGRIDAESVKALQAQLKAQGFDLGPAGADGKFGPKTHAALIAFLEGAEPVPAGPGPVGPRPPAPPATQPPAARPGAPDAPTITDTRVDPGYKLGNPPPAGYRAFRGAVPPEVGLMARKLLGKPFGTETYFEANGRRYVARNEPHYHPPGFKGGPNGWHSGVTVYEAS